MACCKSGNSKLDAAVNTWLRIDKNPVTKQEVLEDIENSRWDKLGKVMLSRQKFGTAGLRAPMAAGYKCMNDVVVLQTAQGLCSYLLKECSKDQLNNGIVIGFDGRYNSKRLPYCVTYFIPIGSVSLFCIWALVDPATLRLYGIFCVNTYALTFLTPKDVVDKGGDPT